MNFKLKRPCAKCPFRSDKVFPLHPGRTEDILNGLLRGGTFACHETVDYDNQPDDDEDGDSFHVSTDGEQHSAGAAILLEKMNAPNQMMRIAERLGLYDRTKLDMSAPVYEDDEEMLEAITNKWNEDRKS